MTVAEQDLARKLVVWEAAHGSLSPLDVGLGGNCVRLRLHLLESQLVGGDCFATR